MPAESDKAGGELEGDDSSDAENERPTVSPPFDPVAFARDVSKPSSGCTPAVVPPETYTRETPPGGIEQATVAKSRRTDEPPVGSGARSRRKTPTTTLSLANARIPSDFPPARSTEAPKRASQPPSRSDEASGAEFEIATRPPPADAELLIELAQIHPHDLEGFGDDCAAETVRGPLPVDPGVDAPPKARDREMRDRVSLGDYSGALEIAEAILSDDPGNEEASACAENCRTVLRQMYATRIGPLDRVPVVMVPRDQLRWLSIDHKAGFVLSLVDGVSSLEMIIDVSGMPELDTLRILSDLAQQRIISLR